jgi:hypothetical protein
VAGLRQLDGGAGGEREEYEEHEDE